MAGYGRSGTFEFGSPMEGEFIVTEWHPDPQVLEYEILKMARDFENWFAAMEEARTLMIADTKEHFANQRDPNGMKWTALDPK